MPTIPIALPPDYDTGYWEISRSPRAGYWIVFDVRPGYDDPIARFPTEADALEFVAAADRGEDSADPHHAVRA